MYIASIPRCGRLAFWFALPLLLVGLLLAAPAGLVTAQGEPPFGEDVVTATTTFNLHIRNEPSRDAESLAILPAGTVVGFTGLTDESGEWVQVDAADGPTGWVSAAFLSNVPDGLTVWRAEEAEGEEEVAVEPPFGEDVVTATTTANLRIRSEPNLDAEVLATLPAGTVVGFTGLTDESGDWAQVDAADGPTGWVSAAFLSDVPEGLTVWSADETTGEEEVAAEPPFGEDVVTATTTVNLHIRSEPSPDAESLAILPAGTVVGFTGLTDESGEWVQVDAADGPTGWVWAAFLSDVPDGLTVWTGDEEG
jgi:uncharacterized protein YgiM (DUF1202 family)